MASSVVASAAQWIGSLLIQEAGALLEVSDQVQGLQEELELIQQYLRDADAKQEEGEVCALIRQIRKLAYDAEDVIDSYIIRVEEKTQQRSQSKFLRFACFLYNTPYIYELGKQIQMIQGSLKRVSDKLNSYGMRRIIELDKNQRSYRDDRCWKKRPQSYPYDDNYGKHVVGLEKDIPKLVEVLMGEEKNQINVVSIVGMGGSGKTTLARKLYNHPYAKECFDCTAWVFVSQEWRTPHVLSEILRQIGSPMENTKMLARCNIEELVEKLRNILEKKSYLVVLDDVWRREALEEILPALPRGENNMGSKIIITTRNLETIQFQNLLQDMYIYESRPLSEDEGWELFSTIALSHRINDNTDSFEILGKEMLSKCKGLPLAIVALAGVLYTKRSIGEWQQVHEAIRSKVMESTCAPISGSVHDLLALSYDDLPYDLKPCFLHLGAFPEDCQIPTGMLTRMWIAEGLVTAHEEMAPEDIAMQRLEELSNRFMIQVVRTNFKGAIKAIHLHDLLRELCVRKAREQNFVQIYSSSNSSSASDASTITIQSRRAALHSSTSFPTQASNLRSLLLLTRSSILHSTHVSKEALDLKRVNHHFKLLRLLNLWGIKTSDGTIPNQIGNLIHLRYLGIRTSNITQLPTSVGNLRNLLTLDYRNIDTINNLTVKLPEGLWKLELLRHLFLPIEHCWSLEKLQLSAMKKLRILWGIRCDGGADWFQTEMPKLSTTLKKLKVIVSTEKDLNAAFNYLSLNSNQLHSFHCEWYTGVALRAVNSMSHNHCLHKLVLIGLIRVKLSVILPSNLVKLELKDSMVENEDPMVTIGALAHLKFLKLSKSYLGTVFICKNKSFPVLGELYLECLQSLNTWIIETGAMPCLNKLVIMKCGKLHKFPQGLPFMATLQHLEFFGLPQEFLQKAKEYGWSEQRLKLPHNVEAIIEECDSPVDISSIRKLYEQLTAGVFLNYKKQKYWLMKYNEHYYNCFMLYATYLSLCKSDPLGDCYPGYHKSLDSCWEWNQMEESDGSSIMVGKIEPPYNTLIDVRGEFNTKYLSLGVTYKIAYVVMLPLAAPEQHKCKQPAICCLHLPSHFELQEHDLNDKPRGEWTRLFVGKFKTSLANIGKMTFSLEEVGPGLVIKGVVIEPIV